MRESSDVMERIEQLQQRLAVLDGLKKKELGKRPGQRDNNLLRFILKEEVVNRYAVEQLEWVLGNTLIVNKRISYYEAEPCEYSDLGRVG